MTPAGDRERVRRERRPGWIAVAVLSCALPASVRGAEGRIEDNSFLIEEAYNQEPGVVHHISVFQRSAATGLWLYTLTDEWPVGGQDHQLSATIPVWHVPSGSDTATGIGDVQLHYRYALFQEESSPVVSVVRLTALLPTGDADRGLGSGGAGAQLAFPFSARIGERFVTHWNVAGTWIPSARTDAGWGSVAGYAAGQGLVWLALPWLNPLLEVLWTETDTTVAGSTRHGTTLTVNPGFRSSIDFRSGLQIVWGLGVPMGLGPSRGDNGVLLYLSFEHPLWRPAGIVEKDEA